MAYNPNEARDKYGKWVGENANNLAQFAKDHATALLDKIDAARSRAGFLSGGGPGIKAIGEASAHLKALWGKESPFMTVKAILGAQGGLQDKLAAIGTVLAKEFGAKLENPGGKSEDRLNEKVALGKAPGRITDATRIGFVVDTPEQADKIVKALGKTYQVADEGWTHTRDGYFDRKAIIRGPDGMLGEVQFWHQALLDAKEKHGGHDIYVANSKLKIGDPQIAVNQKRMRVLYGKALDHLPSSWDAVKQKGD